MKFLVGSFVLTFASSLAVASSTPAPALKRLSCVSSNGTTLVSVARRDAGLLVESKLGLFQKDFTAALAVDKETKRTTIELTDETDRVSYLVDLTIDLKTRKKQTRYGSIIRTGDGYVAPSVVATVLCDLVVR